MTLKNFLQALRRYHLLGFTVVNENEELGEVCEVIEQPHQILCKIILNGKEALIPVHEDSLEKIDKKNKKLFVNLPEGLLDIYKNPDPDTLNLHIDMQASSSNIIAHFDLDSFFVSVEFIRDPSLKGKAVIVGGSKERGIVTTCSYEARKFGVHSAMPMKTAMRLCPHAIVVKGTYSEYSKYSRWVTQIIASKAPLFEKASIDEFYIDLNGNGYLF